MPNTVMFSNEAALKRGNAIAAWKTKATLEYFRSPKFLDKNAISNSKFDFRDMYTLIPLIIDTSSVDNQTEETRSAYFLAELEKIEHAFVKTVGADGYPNPEAIAPFLRSLYEKISVDYNINWDDEQAISNLFLSVNASQAIGTMVEKLPRFIFDLYPTVEEMKALDNKIIFSYTNMSNFRNMIAERDPQLLANVEGTTKSTRSHAYNVEMSINIAFAEATAKGSDAVIIDPTESEIAKLHFSGEEFEIPEIPDVPSINESYTSDDIAKTYFDSIVRISGKSVFEYKAVEETVKNDRERANFIFINGRPVSDIMREELEKSDMTEDKMLVSVAKQLRDALTDGKSVVNIMRPIIDANGKTHFTYQDVKLDLDKLNKVDRAENYGRFRKALDFIGIWPIPQKYISNKSRDEIQTAMKTTYDYKKSMREAEERYINRYNELAKNRGEADRFYEAFPEIEKADKSLNNEHERDRLNISADEIDNSRSVIVEPVVKGPTEEMVFDDEVIEPNVIK